MKNNGLIVMTLIATLSIIVVVSTITSVSSQRPDVAITALEYEDKLIDEKSKENQTNSYIPKFFAIQHAQSGSISEINTTSYSLQLNDVSDKTILFSDRPDRIVTSVSTADFVGNWSVGTDSFAVDLPNAVLVIEEIEGHQDTAIIEVFNPVYDVDKKVLKYEAIPDNATSIDLPSEFGQNTLIIDKKPKSLLG
ncbi:MAG: hypothetical protein ACPKPY_05230 [Nitrososphaeraceae archaeon]